MFSVIIPVHNKLPHIDRSVNSVLNQSFSNFELILVDDASTDGSSEKLLEYKDPRLNILRRKSPGPGGYAARNIGIRNATYEWISFLDADDEWEKDYLEKVFHAIQRYPDADFITTGYENVYDGGRRRRNPKLKVDSGYTMFSLQSYLVNNSIAWTGVINIKKNLILNSGLFPEGRCRRGGDMDTWIRCLYKSKRAVRVNQTLAYYYRNTVNRVTDGKSNPSSKFCPEDTLKFIKETSNDGRLIKSIDMFVEKYVYSTNIDLVLRGLPINHEIIVKVTSKKRRLFLYLKLLCHKMLFKIRHCLNNRRSCQ